MRKQTTKQATKQKLPPERLRPSWAEVKEEAVELIAVSVQKFPLEDLPLFVAFFAACENYDDRLEVLTWTGGEFELPGASITMLLTLTEEARFCEWFQKHYQE